MAHSMRLPASAALLAQMLLQPALDVVEHPAGRGEIGEQRFDNRIALDRAVVGMLVAIPMALLSSGSDGVDYLTVYLIERTLSLDNLVVFLLIFGSFGVPQAQRGILLFWGIVFALATRGVAIVVGVQLIESFHVVIYILGATLLFLAWRMWKGSAEHADPSNLCHVSPVRGGEAPGGYRPELRSRQCHS